MAARASARLALLQDELRSRRSSSGVDPVVAGLLSHLAERGARVSPIAGRLGLSTRQLHRRCEAALGYPPAGLAQLVRFERFLGLLDASGPDRPRLADLAVAAGYADQSHLARDCRTLTGVRPSSLVRPAGC